MPRVTKLLLPALAALTFTVLPAAAPAQLTAASNDWSKVVTSGPQGAFILGNPQAKTRLVEYMSYTCPHCAHFQAEAIATLKSQWIKRGLIAIEYRNFVRDPFDLTAALLARCGGPGRFLGNHEAIYANYDAWMKQAQTFAESKKGQPQPEDQVAQLTDIADKTGLFTLLAKRGLTPAAQRQCIADKDSLAKVLNLTAGAWDAKEFTGTPFFILNGKALSDVHDWKSLQPLLPALPTSGK